jgi:hypothetical protein
LPRPAVAPLRRVAAPSLGTKSLRNFFDVVTRQALAVSLRRLAAAGISPRSGGLHDQPVLSGRYSVAGTRFYNKVSRRHSLASQSSTSRAQ